MFVSVVMVSAFSHSIVIWCRVVSVVRVSGCSGDPFSGLVVAPPRPRGNPRLLMVRVGSPEHCTRWDDRPASWRARSCHTTHVVAGVAAVRSERTDCDAQNPDARFLPRGLSPAGMVP